MPRDAISQVESPQIPNIPQPRSNVQGFAFDRLCACVWHCLATRLRRPTYCTTRATRPRATGRSPAARLQELNRAWKGGHFGHWFGGPRAGRYLTCTLEERLTGRTVADGMGFTDLNDFDL